jgi:hypothetical protein
MNEERGEVGRERRGEGGREKKRGEGGTRREKGFARGRAIFFFLLF